MQYLINLSKKSFFPLLLLVVLIGFACDEAGEIVFSDYEVKGGNAGAADWGSHDWILFGHTPADSVGEILRDSFGNAYGGLYLIRPSGDEKKTLTLTRDYGLLNSPRWSPDGKWIAFSKDAQIYKMTAIGETLIQLTAGPLRKFLPAWSPDGNWIAFTINDGSWEQRGIWIVNADGGVMRQLRITGVQYWIGAYVSWSPDGSEIVYVASPDQIGSRVITVLDTATAKVTTLIRAPETAKYPRYSPDGSKIIFHTIPGTKSRSRVWVIDRNGANLRQLANEAGEASWSPDGKKIIYTKMSLQKLNEPGYFRLWIMNADGSGKRQLTY